MLRHDALPLPHPEPTGSAPDAARHKTAFGRFRPLAMITEAANKRAIVADDMPRPIFGPDRVTMFEIAKVIGPHLTAP